MPKLQISSCPCCGNLEFSQNEIIWQKLVKEWGLSKYEREYIDKQQGFVCTKCGANLRSMSLAVAIMKCFSFGGLFNEFTKIYSKKVKVLEINEAGQLNQYLSRIAKHTLGSYPQVNMEKLPYKDESFDLVVHSDTLEHVKNPIKALTETRRVLKEGGFACYTIPIITERLSRVRKDLAESYHGSPGNDEYLVVTEYGADMWTQLFEAGFDECRLISVDFPASIVLVGVK